MANGLVSWAWDDSQVVSFDFETSGTLPEYALQPWRIPRGDAWVTSLSMLRFEPAQGLVPLVSQLFPDRLMVKDMLQWVIDHDKIVVGWNLAFDISVCIALGFTDEVFKIRWLDGMLLWRHLEVEPEYEFQTARHKRKSYALKPGAVEQFIPTFAGLDEDVDFHSTEPESLAKLQKYNDRDNVRAWTITKLIWDMLEPPQRQAAWIEASALPQIAQANCHGLPIDVPTCKHLGAHLQAQANALLRDLGPHGVTAKIVRSPKQLGDLLYDVWELPVLGHTKTGARATDKEALHELSFLDPRAKQVRKYREALNGKAKFSDSILESVAYHGDGRSHPLAIPFGTYSGRFTYASKQGKGVAERPVGFALHQMKRDPEFREVIYAPEGYDIVEFDAAGQEFRWMAIASGDQTMLQLCLPGEDAHTFMGAQIGECDYRGLMLLVGQKEPKAKDLRQLGKVGNLSLQYRTSARKLRVVARVDYDIPLELPEAQRIHATYQRSYPGVPVYWNRQIAQTKSTGYVETFAGRRVQVKGNWDGDWGWSMGSTSINYRIQGTGADQKYLAMLVLKDYVRSIGGYFAWDLHDGLYWFLPKDRSRKAVDIMKGMLDNLPYTAAWGFTPPIPMPWDCKMGAAFGRMKEVKFA